MGEEKRAKMLVWWDAKLDHLFKDVINEQS